MDNIFSKEMIVLNSSSKTQKEVLNELVKLFVANGYASNEDELLITLSRREEVSSTLIDANIALPHAKLDSITKIGVVILRTENAVVWNSKNGDTANLFFMIGVPKSESTAHLNIIAKISKTLDGGRAYLNIMNAKSEEEILSIFQNETQSESTTTHQSACSNNIDIVAVTACPTGIAHTYMAAEALKKSAKNKGLNIKVETNGADGVRDILSDHDIASSKVVIIASDRELDLSRFNGKKLYSTKAGETVRKADEVIEHALSEATPIYIHKDGGSSQGVGTSSKKGVYGQLMTGVSYMLPFVVGGGILIALGFMFGITSHDPNADDYNKIAQILNTLGGAGAFALMIPILAGYIGFSIGERPALMPAMVCGLLASNSGGGFLGGFLAGFIGGYVTLLLKKIFSYLPKQLDGLKPVFFYPVFGLLLSGLILMPVLTYVSAINNAMTAFLNSLGGGNLVLLGLILGGMMAVDMGGPVNKAAFTFGIAAIAAGNYYPHAAVMAGGMVPPLGIALATTFAKKLWTPAERESGLACYAMGASFVTEGVIPFAASYPFIIIPSCIIGSAIAGAMSMAFGCELTAPHGGIFVFPLITNVFMYILSIATGSIITALLTIILLKRKQSRDTLYCGKAL